MAKTKSSAVRRKSVSPRARPEPELCRRLDEIEDRIYDVVCELTCAIEVLSGAANAGEFDEDAARAVTLLRHTLKRLEETDEAYENLLLRVAHEGVPRWFRKGDPGVPS